MGHEDATARNRGHDGTKARSGCHAVALLRVFVASWPRGFVASWLILLFSWPAAAQYIPARLRSGDAPAPRPNTVGWAWDVADVTVDSAGRPGAWLPYWGTKGWGGVLWKTVVNSWSFEPAREGETRVESHVLVAACYRPAALSLGPESAAPSVRTRPDVPSPTAMVPPAYPPRAVGDGVVTVELAIDASGAVRQARVVQSAGGFDSAALDAARQWRFRPAQRAGAAVPANAYIVFGFRQPVT